MPRSLRAFDPFGRPGGTRASRPRRTAGGIRARSRQGEFARTWWGHRWIEALEGFGWTERIARGRAYARAGQVLGLKVRPGGAQARVQGSRPTPYRVRIAVRPFPDTTWSRVLRRLRARAEVAAALLAGDLPESVEATFRESRVSLLPARDRELESDCSCPDWANPCKHIAAVHYLLAESMDRDPFVLLALRGRSRSELFDALRTGPNAPRRRRRPAAGTRGPEPVGGPEPAASFWGDPEALKVLPAPPIQPTEVPDAILRRLGEPAFLRGTPELVEFLRSSYARIGERAHVEAFARTPPPGGDPAPPHPPRSGGRPLPPILAPAAAETPTGSAPPRRGRPHR
ncbi:MAG: SWIM zinc finger family protein [Thermoplasmata archaeon]